MKKIVATGKTSLSNTTEIHVGPKPPLYPEIGQLWLNTSTVPPSLWKWDGEKWVLQEIDVEKLDPQFKEDIDDALDEAIDDLHQQVLDEVERIDRDAEDLKQTVINNNERDTQYFKDVWKNIDEVEANLQKTNDDLSKTNKNLHDMGIKLSEEIDAANDDIIANRGEYLGLYGTLDGKHSVLAQNVNGIATRVTNSEGDISKLTQTANSIGTRVTNAEGNISTLSQDAKTIATRVSNAEGNISTVTQSANALAVRMASAEGNITSLTTTANGLAVKIEDNRKNVATVTATATALGTRLTTAEGNISSVTQTASSLSSRMSTAEGNYSSLLQTVNGLQSTVNSVTNGTASVITQMSDRINLKVSTGDVINQISVEANKGVYIAGKAIYLDGDVKVDGTFVAPQIISKGTDSSGRSNYTQITGMKLTSYGYYSNTWRGTTIAGYHTLTATSGYIKMQQMTGVNGSSIVSKPALYYTGRGISTRMDADGNSTSSGTIEFFAEGYSSSANSLVVASSGNIILESIVGSRIYLNPNGAAVHVANKNDTYYDLYARKFFADGTAVTSDENKKKNIEVYNGYVQPDGTIKTALEQILETTVKSYNLKNEDDTEKRRVGIILQEAPFDVVDPSGGVDLYAMVSLLWKAVQELNKRVEVAK